MQRSVFSSFVLKNTDLLSSHLKDNVPGLHILHPVFFGSELWGNCSIISCREMWRCGVPSTSTSNSLLRGMFPPVPKQVTVGAVSKYGLVFVCPQGPPSSLCLWGPPLFVCFLSIHCNHLKTFLCLICHPRLLCSLLS